MAKAYDLPPLVSLPAFEASARLLSFTRASEELNLTQSAVSFQVRKLEAQLGIALFERHHRDLVLTKDGRDLRSAVQNAFQVLADEKTRLARRDNSNQLVISATFSLSSKWLIPRLPNLRASEVGIEVRVDATDQLVDFRSESVDLAIRYCAESPSGLQWRHLFEDQILPVCSASLIANAPTDWSHRNITQFPVLHDTMHDFTWSDWFSQFGLDPKAGQRGSRFSHTASAIDAAIAGQGFALGRLPLVADDILAGRLIRPFAETALSQFSYFAVWPQGHSPERVARAVDWLCLEAQKTKAVLA